MKYRMVERDSIQVIGIRQEVVCDEETGSPASGIVEFWGEANNNGVLNQLLTLNNGPLKALLGITSNFNEQNNTVDYCIGVEYHGDVPGEFSSIKIPAAKWAAFEVRGPAPTAIPSKWRQIYSEWFPANEYEPAAIPCIEAYTDSDPYSPNSLNEIWVAVK